MSPILLCEFHIPARRVWLELNNYPGTEGLGG